MPRPLRVERAKADGRTIVRVGGEIDLDTSPTLLEHLQTALDGKTDVAVDLRAVEYIDSSGVAVLVQALKRAKHVGVELRLAHPSDRVRDVIRLARLEQLFPIDAEDV